ncbi:FAD-binding monooxygenase [Acrocarpospora pleiomorpha]|uniref:FAD-binding monooxygenase n=1 Tax=Acrocarpospora pleiomorpha TaxID=90975 RepID=A0A5M3XJM7_9ACTN|nr:2-polyprenyl-6-methoxyphenol hydroxylase-like oxidoreductase [Acrocarpospora pleiomorpha]GES21160.1 FAD-binding monooxygenase [Acrocarpospora pleiomorpha]
MGRGHAVVLGASMGGLLAARALSETFDRVTLLERDELPAEPRDRRGVPQGRHVHVLLPRGSQILGSFFPGLADELGALGVPRTQLARQIRFVVSGHRLARGHPGPVMLQPTRPTLEHVVRRRVAALPGVEFVQGCDVTGLTATAGRITGARFARRADGGPEETVGADLVIDALGRSGRSLDWLSQLGYARPPEERIQVGIRYVSCFMRTPPDALAPEQGILVGPVPGRPSGMAFMACEGDRWLLTVAGMAGTQPPTDVDALIAFIQKMTPPDFHEVIAKSERLSDPVVHTFPASLRRRYEKLRAYPEGLLVFADGLCSFNPIYGQGMTVASLQAEALRTCLEAGEHNLARRFYKAAAKAIDPAWQLSAAGDLALPEIKGPRPLATRLINRYVARLHRVGATDIAVADAFWRVTGYLDPTPALLRPRVALRVFRNSKVT